MKQNYKIYLCALLLAGAVSTMTASGKPKLVILVVGMETDAKGDELTARWAYDLTQDGAYELAANTATVTGKLSALRTQLKGGKAVDTTGIAQWGRDIGIDYVQLVVQDTIGTSPIENITKRVASLVKCSDGTLVGRGTFRLRFPSPPYLEDKVKKISMVGVRGGEFEMGCKAGRDDKTFAGAADNVPVHKVTVSDFKIGKYEITQRVWQAVMKGLPANNTGVYAGAEKPVVQVNPADIAEFLTSLNALTGKNFRLPTEAEWEYAARGCEAGTCENFEYSGSDIIGDVAWYVDNRPSANAQPVGGKLPNALGIYDMSGNVWEWVADYYDATYYTTPGATVDNPVNTIESSDRVFRGGSWYWAVASGWLCVAARYPYPPNSRVFDVGFRVVLP
jgi:formylglycine-generating enzyme required for sulfatase activity